MAIARAAVARVVSYSSKRMATRGSSRLQEKKGPGEGEGEGGKFSLKYKGNISTPLDGEFA